MNKELEEIYDRVLKILEEGTHRKYIDPDDMAIAFEMAMSKESPSISDKIDDLMQQLYPENIIAVLIHAKNTAMKGDPLKALALYESVDVDEIEMDHWSELPFASHCAIVAGKKRDALEYFRRYLNHTEEAGEELQLHLTALAVDFYTFGCDRKSIAELMEMTVAKIRTPEILSIAANHMVLAHQPGKAVTYLKEASSLDPMNPNIWMMLTKACLQTMDYEGMHDACRYYMALCPETRDFEMLMIQANGYMEERDYELALYSLRRCSHIRGLSTEQRAMLTLATAQVMSGMGESNSKIVDYLKRRNRIIGADERINKLITELKKEE